MTIGWRQWLAASALAACAGLAQPGAAGAATTTFLDPGAWMGAASGIGGFAVQAMPAVSPERITMSDKHGSWTLAGQDTTRVFYMLEGSERSRLRSIRYLNGHGVTVGAESAPGRMSAGFGCDSPVFPCLGMQVAEFQLHSPIRGFAGLLTYQFGYQEFYRPGIDDLASLYVTYFDGVDPMLNGGAGGGFRTTYAGFYGVIFDRPVSTLRFAWYEDSDSDHWSTFRFEEMLAIGVPEPAMVGGFAASLMLLMVLAGRRAAPWPARPPALLRQQWRRGGRTR